MQVKIERNCLNIIPETLLESIFLEEVLDLHESGDSIKLVKLPDGTLRTVTKHGD